MSVCSKWLPNRYFLVIKLYEITLHRITYRYIELILFLIWLALDFHARTFFSRTLGKSNVRKLYISSRLRPVNFLSKYVLTNEKVSENFEALYCVSIGIWFITPISSSYIGVEMCTTFSGVYIKVSNKLRQQEKYCIPQFFKLKPRRVATLLLHCLAYVINLVSINTMELIWCSY